jgi:hypothetical protein
VGKNTRNAAGRWDKAPGIKNAERFVVEVSYENERALGSRK